MVIVWLVVGYWVSKMGRDGDGAGFWLLWVSHGLSGFGGHELGLIVILRFKRFWATMEMALPLKIGLQLFGLMWVSRIRGMI